MKTKAPQTVTADLDTIKAQATKTGEEVVQLGIVVRAATIADPETYEHGVEIVASIKAMAKRIEAVRVSIVGPIKAALDAANGFFKPPLADLAALEADMKGRLSRYATDAAAKQLAEATAAAQALAKAKTPAAREVARAQVVAAVESAPVPKVAGMQMRTIWSGEVTDAALIPREYLIPNLTALLAVTRAQKEKTNIPGWKATSTQSVAVSV